MAIKVEAFHLCYAQPAELAVSSSLSSAFSNRGCIFSAYGFDGSNCNKHHRPAAQNMLIIASAENAIKTFLLSLSSTRSSPLPPSLPGPARVRRLITTIFPRIYARTYYAHPRARVVSFSAREPARFPLQNPRTPSGCSTWHTHWLQPHTHDSIWRAIIHTDSVTICVSNQSKRIFLL